jgi:hypothetical protein
MSTSTPIEGLIEKVVEPCLGCEHAEICKYRFNCKKYAQLINKCIEEINKFVSPEEPQMFTFSFEQNIVPALQLFCEYYNEVETES